MAIGLGSIVLFLSLFVSPALSTSDQQQPLKWDVPNNDRSRVVPRTASPEILERYDTFIKTKSTLLSVVTTETGKVNQGYSLSLSYFDGPGDAEGRWGLLVSYETMEDQTKYTMRRFFDRQRLQPLDPATDRFMYAFAPTLRFGQFASDRGSILVPKSTDGKPTTTVGALYKANDGSHGGALSTVGGTVLAVDQNNQRKYYGLTLATITTGEPASGIPAMRNRFHSPPIERGEGEVALESLGESTSAILGVDDATVPEGLEEISAIVPENCMAGNKPININFYWSIHALNWALVELDNHQNIPVTNTLRSGEPIGLSETEPASGTTLLIATSAGEYELLPRCTLLDRGARVITHHTSGGRRASRFQLLPGFKLYPRDIGAWILEETSDGLKACYQIVALDAPTMFYAFPLAELLKEASKYSIVTLPGTHDNASYREIWDWRHRYEQPQNIGVAVETIHWT